MKNKKIIMLLTSVTLSLLIVGCANQDESTSSSSSKIVETTVLEDSHEDEVATLSKGQEYTNILTSTNWQGTKVLDSNGEDVTKENDNFIGLARYDSDTNFYEFFDKETGETRGDEGTFFLTNDGNKRILISKTMDYQAVVDITELTEDIFTYKRMGVNAAGDEVEVFVEHIPYNEEELDFTNGREKLSSETGEIVTTKPGLEILGDQLWNGTVVLDEDGNDLTKENEMFISIAKFDKDSNKYEFFNVDSGETKGDFGYYDVIFNNKIRTHVSIGENKYGAVLEITELNDGKFTYKRTGKNKDGEDTDVFVEHEPYQGEILPEFTF